MMVKMNIMRSRLLGPAVESAVVAAKQAEPSLGDAIFGRTAKTVQRVT